jgi:rubrerythrin
MADKLVTVMTFNNSFEAQLAKNLLENEGIVSVVTGEFSSDVLLGTVLGRNQIALQVHEDDAQSAVALLAEVELNKDWEDEAESGADVWICSICGEPISNRLSSCYACQSPRDGIRAFPRRDSISTREERIAPPPDDKPKA